MFKFTRLHYHVIIYSDEIIYEKKQLNPPVWGSLTLAPTTTFMNLELTVTVIPYIANFTAHPQSTYTYLALVSVAAA